MIEKLSLAHLDYLATAKETFPDAWDKEMLISGVEKGGLRGFVYSENGKNVGFITFVTSFESADIECVYVNPSHRKKGIAKALFLELLTELKKEKVEKILLEVRKSNFSAIALYKSQGFIEISQRKKYYDKEEDAIIFLREIGDGKRDSH